MPFRFEGLEIWHKAREFSAHIYEVTAKFPQHELYGLASQMNRAANYEWGDALARKINAFRNTLR